MVGTCTKGTVCGWTKNTHKVKIKANRSSAGFYALQWTSRLLQIIRPLLTHSLYVFFLSIYHICMTLWAVADSWIFFSGDKKTLIITKSLIMKIKWLLNVKKTQSYKYVHAQISNMNSDFLQVPLLHSTKRKVRRIMSLENKTNNISIGVEYVNPFALPYSLLWGILSNNLAPFNIKFHENLAPLQVPS